MLQKEMFQKCFTPVDKYILQRSKPHYSQNSSEEKWPAKKDQEKEWNFRSSYESALVKITVEDVSGPLKDERWELYKEDCQITKSYISKKLYNNQDWEKLRFSSVGNISLTACKHQ